MALNIDISALEKRLNELNAEIEQLEKVIRETTKRLHNEDDNDDCADEDSPFHRYYCDIVERLNTFSRDRDMCEKTLRNCGVAIPARDNY